MPKFITAQEAAALIPDHAVVGVLALADAEVVSAVTDAAGGW